jgi:hypothetical protein
MQHSSVPGCCQQLTRTARGAADDATKWRLAGLACRNVVEMPIPAVVALAQKLKGAAVSELQELVRICRGDKKCAAHGCEVRTSRRSARAWSCDHYCEHAVLQDCQYICSRSGVTSVCACCYIMWWYSQDVAARGPRCGIATAMEERLEQCTRCNCSFDSMHAGQTGPG